MATEYHHVEVNCQRSIGGGQFAAGLQDFVFSIGRPSVFIPSKSYFRVELSVKAIAGLQPRIADQLALAENAISNGYNNAYFLAGGQSVSQVTNYMPQISALEARTSNTQAWLKSVGDTAFAMGSNFSERVALLSEGSSTSGFAQKPGVDITYRPTDGAGNYSSATVAGNAGAVLGVDTNFSAEDVGATMVINGAKHTIIGFGDALNVNVSPPLVLAVATSDWYLVRRQTRITDGSLQGKNGLQVLWRPTALGIFNYGGVLGSGDYRIQLNPDASFRTAMVETPNTDYKDPDISYALTIENVIFYAATAKMSIPDSIETMRLTEFAALTKNMTSESGNFQFTVPNSTKALYVMIQAGDAGKNPAHPPSHFKVGAGQELDLIDIQITYANATKPMTRWKSGFATVGGINKALLSHLYYQGLIESDRAGMSGGAESQDDWLARGPVFAFRFDKDVDDRSTEVQLNIGYGLDGWDAGTKIFLIAEYSNLVQIQTQQGLVTQVVKVASA
jgi:hypothetical protein